MAHYLHRKLPRDFSLWNITNNDHIQSLTLQCCIPLQFQIDVSNRTLHHLPNSSQSGKQCWNIHWALSVTFLTKRRIWSMDRWVDATPRSQFRIKQAQEIQADAAAGKFWINKNYINTYISIEATPLSIMCKSSPKTCFYHLLHFGQSLSLPLNPTP